MELRHLRYFARAAELLHFTHAAESLYISQSTLSSHMQQLEEELGLPLFKRMGRNVHLTDAGRALLPHALSSLEEIETAKEKIAGLNGLVSGTLKMGSLLSFGRVNLPAWISDFCATHPLVKISAKTGSSDYIERSLASGQIDVGFSFLPTTLPGLNSARLFDEEVFLAVGSDHHLARRPEIALEEISNLPLAAVSPEWAARRIVDALLKEREIQKKVVIEINDLQALVRIIAQNQACALISRLALADYGTVTLIPIKDKPLFMQYGLLWSDQSLQSRPAKAFINQLLGEEM